ncbi:MAG: Two-component hybrid sensor and histidine kinase regulator [Acidobacteria bacterium]|nr:Two-component hybrid sensor and histidine kinase regulator [Acidobacteriota bacterium]
MALLAAVMLTAVAAWTITSLYHHYSDVIDLAKLSELSANITHLDETLTSSARVAALSNDPEWDRKYDEAAKEFAPTWEQLKRELARNELGIRTGAADQADRETTRMEREALALAGDGNTAAATALLSTDRYREMKATFGQLTSVINQVVREHIENGRERTSRRNAILIGTCLLLLPLFVISWAYALMALHCYIEARDRAEQSVRESDERFSIASRATNDVIWDWNLADNTVWFNEALQTNLGYSSWGMVNITRWADAIHPEDVRGVMDSIRTMVDSDGQSWAREYRFLRGDGKNYAYILDRGFLMRDADGKPTRMIGAMLDLTDAKRAEAELREVNVQLERLGRKNELILNAAADGIVGLDLDGRATFINRAAAEMLRLSMNNLRGQRFHELIHHTREYGKAHPFEECPNMRALRDGEMSRVPNDIFWRRDQTSFAVEYSTTPMRNESGQLVGAVMTFHDTTERLEVQRMKDEFVSIVSHELRTPLTSIRGALGLLAGGLMASSPVKGQRMLDIAVSNTDRLVRLINDILDIERIDSGKVVLTKSICNAATLLRDSIDVMRPIADKAGVLLELGRVESATINADADRVIQTLTNLLSNAIKFSPSGSAVTISAIHERDGVAFRVKDRGRGIPADKLDSVFDRFQQVDASDSREKGGSGLGLTICRSIVREHGGEMHVESVVGEGSEFRFSIPAALLEASGRKPGAAPRIVVCDDDPNLREVLEAMLDGYGYDVRTAEGGDELLRLLPSFTPDVILLDIFMPAGGGWETLSRLKNNPETAEIPVVILSGIKADEMAAPFDLAGWVNKPLDERTLIATLEHALGLAGRRPRIMIVEDDFDLARVITESFARHGIETCHAATGREAIALAREVTPDLLILDLVLPELDGFGVVEWLREQEKLCKVPMVVYSATDPTTSERQRLTLGPTQFLTKSRVPPQEFERRVVDLLATMTRTQKEIAHVA